MKQISSQLEHRAVQGLLEVAERLNASTDLTEILTIIIEAMRTTLDAERATVFEYDASTDELFSTVAHGINGGPSADPDAEIRIPASAGIAGECAQRRSIINVPDAYADPRFNATVDRRTGFRTRSLLAIPLVDHEGELVGVTQVLNGRSGPFDAESEQIATALASHATLAIKRGRLLEDRLVRLRLEKELAVAHWIQERALPERLPVLPGYDLDAWSESANETGGDTYDAIGVRDGEDGRPVITTDESADCAVLLLADAAGHGVGPALSVTQIRSMLRMAVRVGCDLAVIARHLNAQLKADLPASSFITAWLAVLHPERGELVSFSAGQGPLLHYAAARDEVTMPDSDAVPFGVLSQLDNDRPRRIELAPGDVFVALSDGIFEARSPGGQQLGIEPISGLVRAHAGRSAAELGAAIRATVEDHTAGAPADDDRTVLIVRRVG